MAACSSTSWRCAAHERSWHYGLQRSAGSMPTSQQMGRVTQETKQNRTKHPRVWNFTTSWNESSTNHAIFPERRVEGRFLGAVSLSSMTSLAWFKLLNLNLLDLTCLTWTCLTKTFLISLSWLDLGKLLTWLAKPTCFTWLAKLTCLTDLFNWLALLTCFTDLLYWLSLLDLLNWLALLTCFTDFLYWLALLTFFTWLALLKKLYLNYLRKEFYLILYLILYLSN